MKRRKGSNLKEREEMVRECSSEWSDASEVKIEDGSGSGSGRGRK